VTGPEAAPERAACAGGPSRAHPAPRLPPLLPGAARRPAAVIAVCCAAVSITLAALVAGTSRPGPLDRGVDHWLITRLGPAHRAMVLLMDLGEPIQSAIVAVALVAGCLTMRRINVAALTAISYPLTSGLTELVLKPTVGRTLGSFTVYPSGHTSRAFALATVAAVALIRPAATRARNVLRIAVMAAGALLAAGVAVAMISLQFHYFTDTVGGAAVGIAVVLATTFPLDRPRVLRRLQAAASYRQKPEC
jgi:membrane-associated phospholipid phosphatase